MTIKFTDSVTSDVYWCARGGKEAPYGFSFSGERSVQVAQFCRAESVRARGRGNRSITLEFNVDKEYDTLEDAAIVAVGEESIIPHEGVLQIDEGSGATIVMDSAFQSIQITQRGVTLTMRYRFVGGGFTNSNGDPIVVPSTLPSPN